MNSRHNAPADDLLRHLVVPVADDEDADATTRTLAPDGPEQVTVRSDWSLNPTDQ